MPKGNIIGAPYIDKDGYVCYAVAVPTDHEPRKPLTEEEFKAELGKEDFKAE